MAKQAPANRQSSGKRGGLRSTSFKPGQSGNPSGRPKPTPEMLELRALCRQHSKEAVAAIVRVMNDEEAPPAARVSAASEILDRGWGRASATVETRITHRQDDEPVSVTEEWIRGLLEAATDKPVPH